MHVMVHWGAVCEWWVQVTRQWVWSFKSFILKVKETLHLGIPEWNLIFIRQGHTFGPGTSNSCTYANVIKKGNNELGSIWSSDLSPPALWFKLTLKTWLWSINDFWFRSPIVNLFHAGKSGLIRFKKWTINNSTLPICAKPCT